MNEDIIAIVGFFSTAILITLGLPLIIAWNKRKDREPPRIVTQLDERLARMETAIDTMAVEIERIAESQRFVTKLMADREKAPAALPRERES